MRAIIYTRISVAALGDTTKTDDQERQCRELCERRGWDVGGVFTDPSKSAWKRDRKRPGWDAMLAEVGAGQAAAIVTYWGDRLVRQPRDLEELLDLADGRGMILASVGGQYSFDNPDHRMMMRWEVARACNESDNISRRRRNMHERLRAEGKVRSGGRGGRAFGFETDNMTQRPGEVAIIREAARRLLAGESAGSAARDFARRGVMSTGGTLMSRATLRKMLARPRYAGLMPDGISPAAWAPVLDRPEWELLRALLDDIGGDAVPNASNARRYVLSGIAECGHCEPPVTLQLLQSKGRNGRPPAKGYGCKPCGKVYRSQPLLDAFVGGRVVKRLANPQNPAASADDGGVAAELAATEKRRAETVKVIEELADHPEMSPEILMRSLASFDSRIANLRERLGDGGRARLLARYAGISLAEWEDLDLSVQRSLVTATFRVIVKPASRRGPGFNPADVLMSPL